MIELPFTKMHGLGNCFILMDDRDGQVSAAAALPKLTAAVCDRNFGIGADNLILVQRSKTADFKMQIYNEDGSEAEMCGNAARCFAQHVVRENMADASLKDTATLNIETLAGIIRTDRKADGDVEVDMGTPALKSADVDAPGEVPIAIRSHDFEFTFVSMGNPHVIAFVDSLEFDWRAVGAALETAPAFPNRTNVEFVKILNAKEAVVKVWERGCGATQACGTGACAVAVAGAVTDRLPREPITIHLPGGPLRIHWNDADRVIMTGPTHLTCQGVYYYGH
ncbi:MAG: diaminopimelate epimerase [Myxococcota bacterium]|nr:diaminopimelate epimerase [Myxococcota bacterium]